MPCIFAIFGLESQLKCFCFTSIVWIQSMYKYPCFVIFFYATIKMTCFLRLCCFNCSYIYFYNMKIMSCYLNYTLNYNNKNSLHMWKFLTFDFFYNCYVMCNFPSTPVYSNFAIIMKFFVYFRSNMVILENVGAL